MSNNSRNRQPHHSSRPQEWDHWFLERWDSWYGSLPMALADREQKNHNLSPTSLHSSRLLILKRFGSYPNWGTMNADADSFKNCIKIYVKIYDKNYKLENSCTYCNTWLFICSSSTKLFNDKKKKKSFMPKIADVIYIETRMTTFIKTKFKISDDQTNIDKYRLTANITVYHIISN